MGPLGRSDLVVHRSVDELGTGASGFPMLESKRDTVVVIVKVMVEKRVSTEHAAPTVELGHRWDSDCVGKRVMVSAVSEVK
jgi:hypothetical protein